MCKRHIVGDYVDINEADGCPSCPALATLESWPESLKRSQMLRCNDIRVRVGNPRTAQTSTKSRPMRRTGITCIDISGLVGYHNAERICAVVAHSSLLRNTTILCRRRVMYDNQDEFRIWPAVSGVLYASKSNIPGTITSSFFFVRNLNNRTSSSRSNSSTRLPAAPRNFQTALAISSALCIPLSFRPFE